MMKTSTLWSEISRRYTPRQGEDNIKNLEIDIDKTRIRKGKDQITSTLFFLAQYKIEDGGFVNHIITDNETWISHMTIKFNQSNIHTYHQIIETNQEYTFKE